MPVAQIFYEPSMVDKEDVWHFAMGLPRILHDIMGTPEEERDEKPVWYRLVPNTHPYDHMPDFELRVGFHENNQKRPPYVLAEYRRQLAAILQEEAFLQGAIRHGVVQVRTHVLKDAEVTRLMT